MDDFDNDGLLDIMTSTWDPCGSMAYYRNDGNGSFSDHTSRAGLSGQLGGLNMVQADYDNDGWMDALVMRGGWMRENGRIRMSLLRNNADGTFSDVTVESGLSRPSYPSQSAAWADYDSDGDLDLFSCSESEPVRGYDLVTFDVKFPSQLFRNNGDGTFTDVANEAGVTNLRYCKGSAWGDFDGDGDPDLYVSNYADENRLYRNDGDGSFTDVAADLGLTEPRRSFATWFWDYDNDGLLDLFVAGYGPEIGEVAADYLGLPNQGPRPRLYKNAGDAGFVDVTRAAGLYRVHMPMGANYGDLDNDGYPDFYLGTGYPTFDAVGPNVMYRNDGGESFSDVTFSGGFGHLQKGHGVAFGDLDRDGDQDIFVQMGGFYPGDGFPNALFENPGHGGRCRRSRRRSGHLRMGGFYPGEERAGDRGQDQGRRGGGRQDADGLRPRRQRGKLRSIEHRAGDRPGPGQSNRVPGGLLADQRAQAVVRPRPSRLPRPRTRGRRQAQTPGGHSALQLPLKPSERCARLSLPSSWVRRRAPTHE